MTGTLIAFLENMFDGDDILPDADKISGTISRLEKQLTIFANQIYLFNGKRRHQQLERF